MSAPALTVSVNGGPPTSGDLLNTFEQTCNIPSDLRSFIGVSGVQVYMRGYSSPGDGGQGNFYWNALGTAADDNGVTTIAPYGSILGVWTRLTGAIYGTTTNTNALPGQVGEYVVSTILSSAPVPLSSGVGTNITSISLTGGDWDVSGLVGYIPANTTTTSFVEQSLSLASATIGAETNTTFAQVNETGGVAAGRWLVGTDRFSLAATTVIYLVSAPSFGVSTMTGFGTIRARRVR